MIAVVDRLGSLMRYLWSAWAGFAGLCLLAALWQAGHETYGSFILPAPLETARVTLALLHQPETWDLAGLTTLRALQGFMLAAAFGAVVGAIAGYSAGTLRVVRPVVTVLLGVPPIAWIVLAMIWFGSSTGTILVTILIAAFPLTLVGVAEGVMNRDRRLEVMARAYGAGPLMRFRTLALPHLAGYLFPALVITLGTAFKVAVMAELLANAGGIGGALAQSRANLDVAQAMAWIVLSVGALIAVEYGLIHPVRAEIERWREATRPWGVKR